ncbi:MAG TPA: phage major capsid protein [Pyrinomonadaceae bacterium]|jgi:HK97 family phage major capsid protein
MPEQEFNREKIVGARHERSIALDVRALEVDEENRTVELAFSSNEPIYHWFGYLKLDHQKSSIRMKRLESAGALLWAHDSRQQIGCVESVSLDEKGGVCRAVVKFSDSAQGDENFRDVKNGIKRSVSFGFLIYDLEPEVGSDGNYAKADDGEMIYVSRDWEPFEISLVSIPADITVGVGRNLDLEKPEEPKDFNKQALGEQRGADSTKTTENEMGKENENQTGQPPVENEQTRSAEPAAPAVQNPMITRATEFAVFGRVFGEEELARDLALDPTKTLDDVRAAIKEKREKNQAPIQTDAPENIAQRSGQQIIEPAHVALRSGPLKAFKGQDAQKNALRAGHFLRAKLYGDEESVKFCRENGISLSRTHSGSNNAKGGIFVIPEVENAIIDLRIQYGVFRANTLTVPMGSDTKNIHRRKGGLTAYPSGAGQSVNFSDTDWDEIELVARKWKVLTKLEDELEEDSVINFADMLVSEIAYAFTYSEDNAGFNGDGTSTYHGIVGVIPKLTAATAGLKTASGNAWSEITRQDLLGVVGLLPQFARKSGNIKWYCSHEFWANVLQSIATAAGGVTHAEIEGELKEMFFGKPVEIVEVMPHTEANSQIPLLYGNLAMASTMGDRRGVTIKMSDSNDTDFEKDLQTLKGTERFDINVHDVGDASAAGPIVGLITASS